GLRAAEEHDVNRTISPAMAALCLGTASTLVTFSLAAPAFGQAAAPLKLVGRIELPDVQGRIDHLSIDPKGRRLFVAALGNDTVEVIDLAAAKRVQTIRGLAEPQGVLVVPELSRLFVASGKDGTVRLFEAATLAPSQTIDLGDDADNLRLDPTAARVWV